MHTHTVVFTLYKIINGVGIIEFRNKVFNHGRLTDSVLSEAIYE